MKKSKIDQQVDTLLERIRSGVMDATQLKNCFKNVDQHPEVTDTQREELIEAISVQLRKNYPRIANQKFGPVNRDSQQKLEVYLNDLKTRFDLSANGHKTKVKVGGDVINGHTLVNDYISYKNSETKVMCHLFYTQKDHDAAREVRVVMNKVGAWDQSDTERAFPEISFSEACELFEEYLRRVMAGDVPTILAT